MFVSLALTLVASGAHGHGSSHAKPGPGKPSRVAVEEKSFGRAGDPGEVVRTLSIDMSDEMQFLPNGLRLKMGDTVKFEVRNTGKVMHELVLGTMEELKAHAELMRKHPGMEHDEPYMAHVAPGKTETIVWQFTRAGEFYYGCLIPGHFEAGMIGKVTVTQ
jgi:uncharacterized cupredoxin-like copper-binding protein